MLALVFVYGTIVLVFRDMMMQAWVKTLRPSLINRVSVVYSIIKFGIMILQKINFNIIRCSVILAASLYLSVSTVHLKSLSLLL